MKWVRSMEGNESTRRGITQEQWVCKEDNDMDESGFHSFVP